MPFERFIIIIFQALNFIFRESNDFITSFSACVEKQQIVTEYGPELIEHGKNPIERSRRASA